MAENKGIFLGIAVIGALAIYALTRKNEQASQKILVKSALSSISGKYINAWVKRNNVWYGYDPTNITDSDLTYIKDGEYVSIKVIEACTWTYNDKKIADLVVGTDGWNTVKFSIS